MVINYYIITIIIMLGLYNVGLLTLLIISNSGKNYFKVFL